MNDDQLRDEFERRSSGAQFRADALLPGVRTGIGVRPQPARVARWAPLAGLAAAAVIVVALIIAVPGAAPSPGSKALSVMTTQVFASALRSGSLDNQTVLVTGGIVPFDTAIGGALCEPPGLCPLGQIENVQPRLAVSAEQVAAAAIDNAGDLGTSWTHFSVPVRGTLLLFVDQTGGVEYLGRAAPNGDQLAWSAGAVKTQLDVNSQDLSDVVLVNGWLTGVDFPAPCQSFPAQFPGLPDRNECGRDSWIADEPAVLTAQSEQPPSAIEVQPDAFADYAPDPTARTGASLLPQRAIYAVARRLYGQFCAPTSPCWDWFVVGRLSQPPPNVEPRSTDYRQTPPAQPTWSPQETPSVVATPTSQQIECGGGTTLVDTTGEVASCADDGDVDYHTARQGVTAGSDSRRLVVTFGQDFCELSEQVSVADASVGGGTGFQVTVAPTSFDPRCVTSPDAHAIDIEFVQPVSPDGVSLIAESGIVTCKASGDIGTGVGEVAIQNGTGRVISCEQSAATGPTNSEDSAVNVQPNSIRVDWTDDKLAFVELSLNENGGHLELASPDYCRSCTNLRYEIVLTFANDLDASSLWLGLDSRPVSPAASPAAASPSPMESPTGYSVHIADGLQPNWTGAEAASAMFNGIKDTEQTTGQILRPAQVVSVEAMRGRDVPRAVSGPYGDLQIAWVVHAYGTFLETRAYSGGPSFYSEGWYIFGDTGHLVGESLTQSAATP